MKKYLNLKTLLQLTFLLLAVPSLSQTQPDMIVEHYTQENGLPTNTVYSSIKDDDGFVWFGTWHGLCSFDGFKFTPFITRSTHLSDIPPRKVRNIVADKDGNLWIRNTDNHLYLFNKSTVVYHDIYNELQQQSRNVQVIKIQKMDNGHVLVLTRNKDLYEVYVGKQDKVVVRKIHDSSNDIDDTSLMLRHNILEETEEYVYWISTKLNIDIITKKNGKALLSNLSKISRPTCFSHIGQYLCVGMSDGNVYVVNIDSGKAEHYSFPELQYPISSINIIGGKVYVTTQTGLWAFDKGSKPTLISKQVANTIKSFTDKYNKLWLCTERKLLFCYDPKTASSQSFTMPSDSLFAEMKFTDTGSDGLFILLRNGEVWRYNHNLRTIENINKRKEFIDEEADPHFFDINVDPNGILWLSSTSNGVYKVCFPRKNFKFLFPQIMPQTESNNENNSVRAIYQSRNGDIWIGTRKGDLYCVDGKTQEIKTSFSQDEIGVVYNIMEDDKGNFWFSTKGAGLVKATPDALFPKGLRMVRYTANRNDRFSISSNRVYNTLQDSHGRIWVCTFYGGLNLIEQDGEKILFINKNNRFKHYPRYELYTDVRLIAEDNHGRMWVGTTDGLMSFSGNFKTAEEINFETYREQHRSGVIDNDIFTMYKDKKGFIWMGIFGNGLNKLEYYDERNHQPVLKSYTINERQGGDVITSIIEDNANCLWVCTENGLASLHQGSTYVRTYDKFAGFPNVNVEESTSICLKDGRVLIGCRQGLLAFSPETVKDETENKYNTFIVDFRVANTELWDLDPPVLEGSLKYVEKVVLKHDQSTFTIEFSSPHFTDNNDIPYIYILDGYEDQWHYNVNNRVASYANVPPGHYKFRVKVNDNNSPERVIEIVISPPWWATWWAYVIYAIIFLAVAYGIMRMVLYTIKMRNEVYINSRLAELKIRFFTNVSHELRTPLSLIKGPIEEMKSTEKLTATGKEYLALIDRNARKMLQLVNQILDFRKIQNGKMKLHVSYVDINGIIEMLMQEFRIMAEERDIDFVFEKPEEHVMVWCDAEKIGVVLNNLINNAFKYTDEGGKICVALEHDYDRKICTIRVEDDGVEIPKSQLEFIFERFSQASNKTFDDTATGTGIGLSLSKEYINMHHGRIWAENLEDSQGVVFSVELPTGKEKFNEEEIEVYFDDRTAKNNIPTETVEPQRKDTQVEGKKQKKDVPTILLIEDNTDMCRMLYLQLNNDYNVFTAHDGNEGLKKIYQHHPDIIITDLMMPGKNGIEILHSVRQDFNISHIPVIVLTAKNTEEDKMTSIKAGANAFIVKPFNSDYLIAQINQLLEEQRIFQRKIVMQNSVESSNDDKDEYERHLVKQDIEFIHKIHAIIEENLNANDFNIDTIAGTIGLSRSAFFKKLKSLTGFAPVDLVREIRLTKAAKKIESTDDSITEIAYSVGFRDAGYFGKCFRKKYGVTPKEYRAKARE